MGLLPGLTTGVGPTDDERPEHRLRAWVAARAACSESCAGRPLLRTFGHGRGARDNLRSLVSRWNSTRRAADQTNRRSRPANQPIVLRRSPNTGAMAPWITSS